MLCVGEVLGLVSGKNDLVRWSFDQIGGVIVVRVLDKFHIQMAGLDVDYLLEVIKIGMCGRPSRVNALCRAEVRPGYRKKNTAIVGRESLPIMITPDRRKMSRAGAILFQTGGSHCRTGTSGSAGLSSTGSPASFLKIFSK